MISIAREAHNRTTSELVPRTVESDIAGRGDVLPRTAEICARLRRQRARVTEVNSPQASLARWAADRVVGTRPGWWPAGLLGPQDQSGGGPGGIGPGERSHGIGQDESGPGYQEQR